MGDADKVMHISDGAVKRLHKLMVNTPDTVLRLSVEGGGCSGFQYLFQLQELSDVTDEDRLYERDGAKLVVDEFSYDLIKGSSVDYRVELIRAAFAVDNPNAAEGCGCGVSFNLKGQPDLL